MCKVKFIDKSKYPKCWGCNATGLKGKRKCKLCGGTGNFKRDNYTLIYTDNKGQKMAFIVDGIK